ncbi:MAG TPA: glycosyltransferase family 4 protein [Clostridia bacterium]|nr:glycosyltransferase family 4 protein [Clostridia bacterium]
MVPEHEILLLGIRNLALTCGEQRLIDNRAKAMYKEFGLRTLAISIVNSRHLAGEKKIVFGQHLTAICLPSRVIGLPMAILRLCCLAQRSLAANTPNAIIVSGSFLLTLVPILRRMVPGIVILWDVHGVAEELIEGSGFSIKSLIARRMVYRFQKHIEKALGPTVDGCIVVSRKMAQYVSRETGLSNSIVLPCGVDFDEWPLFLQYDTIRKTVRQELELGDGPVFVYSGSMAPWQCFAESVRLFRAYQAIDSSSKLVVLTRDTQVAQRIISEERLAPASVVIKTVRSHDVPRYLIAADVGLLLRKPNVTNLVAAPNKFGEYMAAGLLIITGRELGDYSDLLADGNLGIVLDSKQISQPTTAVLELIRECLQEEDPSKRQLRRKLAEEQLDWRRLVSSMNVRSQNVKTP